MTEIQSISIEHLGQSGLRVDLPNLTFVVDPYLSNSVQVLEDSELERQMPIPYLPEALTNVDWIFISHSHMDHCDPQTIPILSQASSQARFMGPLDVRQTLIKWGICESRIYPASQSEFKLEDNLTVKALPSAHPVIRYDSNGDSKTVSYIFRRNKRSLYLACDTSVCDELLEILKQEAPIHTAFLPVNEDNYFRRKRGIIGNMSVREAFGLADVVGIENVVPVHWDMFKVNSAEPDEIRAVYDAHDWSFNLINANKALI